MKVKRIRFVGYGNGDKGLDWVEVGTYENAELSQLDPNSNWPGNRFDLRIPFYPPVDSELYHDWPGSIRVVMVGAEISTYYSVKNPTIEGFVDEMQLKTEERNRQGLFYRGKSYFSERYVREVWHVDTDK